MSRRQFCAAQTLHLIFNPNANERLCFSLTETILSDYASFIRSHEVTLHKDVSPRTGSNGNRDEEGGGRSIILINAI